MAKKKVKATKTKKEVVKTTSHRHWSIPLLLGLLAIVVLLYIKGTAKTKVNSLEAQNNSVTVIKPTMDISLWEQGTEKNAISVPPKLLSDLQSILGPNPRKTDLTNSDIQTVTVAKDSAAPESEDVTVTFTQPGKAKLLDITTRNEGKVIAVVVNGRLVEVPRVIQPISSGKIEVTGKFTEDEIKGLPTTPLTDVTPIPQQF